MNKYRKLLSNTVILGFGTFGSKLLVFCMVRFYTSCLNTEQYGIADVITQTANLLIPLLSVGIAEAVFRFALDRETDKKAVFSTGFFTILAGGAVFGLLTPLLELVPFFRGYSLLVFSYTLFSCLHTLCMQFIRAEGKMKLFAVHGILSTALTILLNLLFLLVFQWGVVGYVLSVVLSDVFCTVSLFLSQKLYRLVSFRSLRSRFPRAMLKFSIPLIPTTVFWWMTNVADRYMVTWMIGSDADGLYAVAYKIPTLLILLSGIFIEAWQFSAISEKGDQEHAVFFGNVFNSFQALMFIAGAVLTALAKIAVQVMAAEEYYPAWQYVPMLSVATIFSSLVTFMGSVYLVEKKSVLSFLTSMTGALLNLVLNLLLIPTFLAVNGAAIATFFSYFVVFIIRALNAQKYISFPMHPVKLTLNTAIVLVQAYWMITESQGWIFVQIGAVLLVFGLNLHAILAGVGRILDRKKRTAEGEPSPEEAGVDIPSPPEI
ncbi:MAG: polysaccharide biosynthesis C-terminal domain-containing protein [Clostridia bacterium]|nr:polysaccharide biosynthesis C-terminal domain-containing protein [Clostridia bacterium]